MIRLWSGGARQRLVASIAVALLAFGGISLAIYGFSPEPARDYEECVEAVAANPPASNARADSMTDCNARFAGRRKASGGYTYYDFMQGRNFDIVGPNPTAQERDRIDREYMGFLDTQRRESISAELAKRQNELLQADIERQQQAVGPPLLLTPGNTSSPAAKRTADRSKSAYCEENPLSCGWSRLSTVVKNAFASSFKGKP